MPSPSEPGGPSPGWYDDGHGAMRWWDGSVWTEHVARADAPTLVVPRTDPATDAPPPAARRSWVWIVWVILGVVIVGIVIAVALLLALVPAALPTGSAPSATPTASAAVSPGDRADPYIPVTADEQGAAATLEQYQQAWLIGDCEGYLAATAKEMQDAQQFTDCETFVQDTRANIGWNDDFEWTIREMEMFGTVMTIDVTESYTSRWDIDAEAQTDEPVDYEYLYRYTLVTSGEGWTIRDIVDMTE